VVLELRKRGFKNGKKKVLRMMRENELLCKKRKNRKRIESFIKSYYIGSKLGINIMNDITINRPYQVVTTDFTEIITISGKYYLIVYLCYFTKKVLSWRISDGPDANTAIRALKPILGLFNNQTYIHQDQGSAFTSYEYVKLLMSNDLFISYSEAATPTDNGGMESFFGRLKDEWFSEYFQARNKQQLKSIFNKIINYYNNERIHTTVKDTPQNFLEHVTNSPKSV
jgi:putative transposase